VRQSHQDIQRILRDQGGLIGREQNPQLASALDWLLRRGQLVKVLPGVYATPTAAVDPTSRIRAVQLWNPDAVVTHEAAAKVTFWPRVALSEVRIAAPSRSMRRTGYRLSQRAIPADLVVQRHGIRCTNPALTALDLSETVGGDAIDALLRSRQATLTHLHEALARTGHRRGNLLRRRLVLESRANPWSPPERLAHRLLRDEGITGWEGNFPILVCGVAYYVDIAFPKAMLAVEIDGREYHEGPEAFEGDRSRQNDLVNAGWRVLRFTPRMLSERPWIVIAVIRTALAASRP
jgi:very-short-patch-repair endonuclease